MTTIQNVNELGQAIWVDYIRRAFIESGDLQKLIDEGVRGVTSNPAIFEKAIAGSADYNDALPKLVKEGYSTEEMYEALAFEDIKNTADLLRPIYDELNGADGYVSLEVSPTLAYDTRGTIAEGRRLFKAIDRPNVMIKVPATAAGIPAIATLIGEGINVNVTLMFSLTDYESVADAYLRGLERRAAGGGDISTIASVASFFISRVDSEVDAQLDEIGNKDLKGAIAIANAKVTYARYLTLFSSERWQRLARKGARPQRLLWASTGVKNPEYPDTLYIDNLMGSNTVNTMPLDTIDALRERSTVAEGLIARLDEAREQLNQLAGRGIDLEVITQHLQDDGVRKFASAFRSLLDSIESKRNQLELNQSYMTINSGLWDSVIDEYLNDVRDNTILMRIWSHDHTVWSNEPDEITNRLGWLNTHSVMSGVLPRLQRLRDDAENDGFTNVLLLGMGGSSLAPEVFSKTFGESSDGLSLFILDSTDPDAVLAKERQHDVSKTLFIVSTKSGGTEETLSFFKYFYNKVQDIVGTHEAGKHFIAITDPGSKLVDIANRYKFRDTFLNDPNIGGRYSALSYFGLAPAALLGVDIERLLDRADTEARNADACNCSIDGDNRSGRLGTIIGALAKSGRDKLTIISSPSISSFGDWTEQLVAESTGKNGTGILPVVGETVGEPEVYGDDRIFLYLRLAGEEGYDEPVGKLEEAGHPVITVHLEDRYDLGRLFFMMEMATAVAGYHLGINPFDQPNVEAAKVLAREMVTQYRNNGRLPEAEPTSLTHEELDAFLDRAKSGDYISIQAYVPPDNNVEEALQALRRQLRERTHRAVTLGYGPRFLHSTGQLHKGDGGNGLFIQFVSDPQEDVAIPDEAGKADSSITFGILKTAQALGDEKALHDRQRRVVRFHLGRNILEGLNQLTGVTS